MHLSGLLECFVDRRARKENPELVAAEPSEERALAELVAQAHADLAEE